MFLGVKLSVVSPNEMSNLPDELSDLLSKKLQILRVSIELSVLSEHSASIQCPFVLRFIFCAFVIAGGMIASKLASMAPERVISLAMLSTTGGGYQCLPKVCSYSMSDTSTMPIVV